jgi:hypothetical protein
VTFRHGVAIFRLFLDRTVEARRHEKPPGSTTGIIPGNRGKGGGNWCRPPLSGASRRQANITSSSGRRRSRSSYATKELCNETRPRNRAELSQVRGQFQAPPPMQLPRGLRLLLYDQDAAQCSGGSTPPKGPARNGWARKGHRAAGSGRVWQSSQNLLIGAARKTASPNCKSKAT